MPLAGVFIALAAIKNIVFKELIRVYLICPQLNTK